MLLLLALAVAMGPVLVASPYRAVAGVERGASGCTCGQSWRQEGLTWRDGRWEFQSASFCVQAADRGRAAQLGALCEEWKHRLSQQWLGPNACRRWEAKCVVIVHRSAAAYERAVGAKVASAGASTLYVGADGILGRRIDLRGDTYEAALAALPHEITHVVLADVFGDRPLPAWADEGMATLADAPAKRAGHAAELRAALAEGRCFRVMELLAMEDYPPPRRMGVFYAQSMSLVQFLAELGGHESVPRFVVAAHQVGYDAALRSTYGLNGVRDLEQRWRHALSQR